MTQQTKDQMNVMIPTPPPGTRLHVLTDMIEVLDSGGEFEVFAVTGEAETGPPPHAHPWREAFLGLEGELEVSVGDQVTLVRPGMFLCVEPGVVHTFRMVSETARFLAISSGTRASGLFADLDANAPHAAPTAESMPTVVSVIKRNGVSSPLFD
jgi:quercetin dioxygenase-like cupin family protein